MKVSLQRIMSGCGYGAVAYLALLALQVQTARPTTVNIVSVLMMSALIGLLTLVFDVEQFSYLKALLLHIGGTLILVISMLLINHWQVTFVFWSLFVGIYLVLWGVVRLNQYLKVAKINQALSKRQATLASRNKQRQ